MTSNKLLNIAQSISKPNIRVLTLQSKEVVDILMSNGIYYADKSKAREGSFDERDFEACGGNCPIWVFQHPVLKNNEIGIKQLFDLLEIFRCEMSIDSLDSLYLLELSLDRQPPIGIAHNGSSLACVIPRINKSDVLSVSRVIETEFYFYTLEVEYTKEDAMFKKTITGTKISTYQIIQSSLSLVNIMMLQSIIYKL